MVVEEGENTPEPDGKKKEADNQRDKEDVENKVGAEGHGMEVEEKAYAREAVTLLN